MSVNKGCNMLFRMAEKSIGEGEGKRKGITAGFAIQDFLIHPPISPFLGKGREMGCGFRLSPE
jgi:hypothetical protein